MKPIPFFLLCVFLLPSATLFSQDLPEDEGKPVSAKITEVTVYADRARVTRSAEVELGSGFEKFSFRKLPGWIDENSVRFRLSPPEAGELVDVEVRKTFLARPDDEAVRKAELAVQEISDQLAVLDDGAKALDAQAKQIEQIKTFSLDKQPREAAVREVKIDEYVSLVRFIGDSMSNIARTRRDIEKKRRDLTPQYAGRKQKLDELLLRSQLEQRTVIATIKSSGKAAKGTLFLTFLLPGATWEPMHEVRAEGAMENVSLASFAVVSQTTGEDWTGVTLALSTQRALDTIKIPELEKLLVGPKTAGAVEDSFASANKKYSGQIQQWNSYANAPAKQREFSDNLNAQRMAQAVTVAKFTRLQDQRGTTTHFSASATQTVRTDGRPVRVLIGSTRLAAQNKIVAAPEISLNAAKTADLLNSGSQPLLPGKVLLFIDGAFLGFTEIDFVANGESFSVFVGLADQIKLTRALDKKRSSLSFIGKRKRMQVSYLVTAENLSDKAAALILSDRIPVSEMEEIRVQNVKITPEIKPDAKGLLKWETTLASKEKKEYRLEYTLDYPVDLAMPVEKPADAMPSPERRPRKLMEQINDLEKAF